MGSKSDYLENKVLDHVLGVATYTAPATVYSALFTAIPSDSSGGTEVTTATSGYTRLATTFATAAAGAAYNTTAKTFATAAAAYTVVGYGIMDAATGGNLLYWATVTTLAIAINDQATFAVSAIAVTED